MAKLIGTGKDPRFPQGQDYDVNELDLDHHIEAGLGEPVEPGTEAYASHRGYDTIAADPGEEVGRPPTQEDYLGASRVSARIETTAFPGEALSAEAAIAKAGETRTEDEAPEGQISTEPQATVDDDEVKGARAADKSGAEKKGARPMTGDSAPEGEAGPGDAPGKGGTEK